MDTAARIMFRLGVLTWANPQAYFAQQAVPILTHPKHVQGGCKASSCPAGTLPMAQYLAVSPSCTPDGGFVSPSGALHVSASCSGLQFPHACCQKPTGTRLEQTILQLDFAFLGVPVSCIGTGSFITNFRMLMAESASTLHW